MSCPRFDFSGVDLAKGHGNPLFFLPQGQHTNVAAMTSVQRTIFAQVSCLM